MGGPATDEMRATFGKALEEAMHDAHVHPREIAEAVGLTHDAVRKWMAGKSEPQPLTTFVVERLLQVAPGDLSRHLGYVPDGAPGSVTAAVTADASLTAEARRLILATYRAGRRG